MQVIAITILAIIVFGIGGAFLYALMPKSVQDAKEEAEEGCMGCVIFLFPVIAVIGLIFLVLAASGAFK